MNYKHAVQKVRAAYVEVDYSELPSGVFTPIGIQLPPGALVIDGGAFVLTASDAATSEALEVGTSSAATAYANVANSKTAGRTAVTAAVAPAPGVVEVGLTRTAVGAQTKGKYGVAIVYLLAGASDGTQG
jgi:hypothetical protein